MLADKVQPTKSLARVCKRFSIFFSEAITYSCFVDLMQRMNNNFPHGGAMDTHFANMRSLIQVRCIVVTVLRRA